MADPIEIKEKRYKLTQKLDETPEVMTIELAPEDNAPILFDPGMFIMISGIDAAGKRYVARSFSVASDPVVPEMEFYIVKHPHVGTALEHDSYFTTAAIGTTFMIKGPYGQFRFDPSKDNKVLFVAGGTGLAPFMSMLRQIKRTNSGNDVVMLYSVKYPTEIIRKQELGELAQQINLKTTITVTRPQPTDNWTGDTGHITAEMIKKYSADVVERMCYICGPPAFVKAVKDALISLGVPAQRVSADVWDTG